ncbi:MAG: hypothetical protein ABIO82_00715, partial [Ginsengibacter sp.]
MITLAWYLLKVIACSGILCGYYFLALRNKVFHRWNRFYLLASIVLSLAIPMMKFNILRNTDQGKGTVVNLLQTVNSGNEIIIEYSRSSGLHFNSENLVLVTYIALTLLFLSIFIFSLYRIF